MTAQRTGADPKLPIPDDRILESKADPARVDMNPSEPVLHTPGGPPVLHPELSRPRSGLPRGVPSSLPWTSGLIGVTIVGLLVDLFFILTGAGGIQPLPLALTGSGLVAAALALLCLRTQHRNVVELADVAGNLSAERIARRADSLEAAPPITGLRLVGPFPVRADDEIGFLAARLNGVAASVDLSLEVADRERARTQIVLSNMVNGVVLTDAAGRVALANPAAERALGRPLSMLLRRTVLEATHHSELARLVDAAAERGEAGSIALYLETSHRNLIARVSPLSEGPPGALVIFQDQEEQKRLDAVRRDFIANVSHELRTPLASIRAMAETILTAAPEDPNTAVNFTEIIIREVDRLARLTDDILDLARYESGRLDRTRVDLNELLGEVVLQQQSSATTSGLELRSEIGDLPSLYADRSALRQVFLNLLENALKYTSAGTITVRARTASSDEAVVFRNFANPAAPAAERWAVVEVADTGPGIATEHLSRLFERFYRVDRGRSRDLGGTGLGLSIARHVTEAHGGRIDVSSVPGSGSTFTVWLPAGSE